VNGDVVLNELCSKIVDT